MGSAVALCGGVVLHAINIYIATTILPSVVKDIGGLAFYAWNTTLFVVASIMGSALSGRLLRLAGPRGAYLVATLIFMLGSLMCALAPSMPLLLLGRTIQGFGGGFLFALSYTLIHLVFHESLWPRAMALVSAMWGVATLIGPAVGGIFAELNVWRYAFGMLVPVGLMFVLLVWHVMPARQATVKPVSPLPMPQLLLLAGAALVVSAGSLSSRGAINLGGFVVAVLMLLLLLRQESRSPVRLLPRGSLSPSSPLFGLYLTMSLLMMGIGCEIFIPYFLQTLHGQTPLAAGYITAAVAAGWTAAEVWSASWHARGARFAIIAGPVLMAIGLLMLLFHLPDASNGGSPLLIGIVCGLALIGFGIGFGWPHLLTHILLSAESIDQDTAGASITTVQSFAAAMGAALAGTIANLAGLNVPGGVAGASHAAFWLLLLSILAPLMAIVTAVRASSSVAVQTAAVKIHQ
ncbi:MFS transporter [Acerihabitans sp. TG2]|uniref:MFS transporter n=1 Tax=Acerihabitans sp. TG2 TaxID=3096008 RepID=UPI002B2333EE|nr:MFS transporter [Acerihabitans sp. TG2]MEA9393214.1 MFS transporter [Acerihabitans sp. TG2]